MQLGYHDTFGTVDHESASGRHVRDHAKIDILDDGLEILMFLIVARKPELGFQRNAVGESAFDALGDAVARCINIIVEKLECEIASCVGDREILSKDLVKALVFPVVRVGLQLEEILERLKLDVEEIRVVKRFPDGREANSFSCFCCQGFRFLGVDVGKDGQTKRAVSL